MAQAQTEPKLLLPFLQPFYERLLPWTWVLVRVGVGWNLIVHSWGKILRGPAQQGTLLAKDSAAFGVKLAILLTIVEFVGGICITLVHPFLRRGRRHRDGLSGVAALLGQRFLLAQPRL